MTSIDVKKKKNHSVQERDQRDLGLLELPNWQVFYIRATREMITGQMVWYVMFPRRISLRHMAYGKPEASATLRSLGWL